MVERQSPTRPSIPSVMMLPAIAAGTMDGAGGGFVGFEVSAGDFHGRGLSGCWQRMVRAGAGRGTGTPGVGIMPAWWSAGI